MIAEEAPISLTVLQLKLIIAASSLNESFKILRLFVSHQFQIVSRPPPHGNAEPQTNFFSNSRQFPRSTPAQPSTKSHISQSVTMSRNRADVVDLTTRSSRQNPIALSSSPPTASNHASSSRHGQLPTARGVKRRRHWSDEHGDSVAHSSSILSEGEPIETIDMTDDTGAAALARTVAKQREDAIKAQPSAESNSKLSAILAYKCPICMETPVDATSTSCGMFLIL